MIGYIGLISEVALQRGYLDGDFWREYTLNGGGVIPQLHTETFTAEQPAPSADGAGGVRALAGSTDAVIAAIIDWVATLPVR